MKSAQIRHHHTAHHDIGKMGDHEVGIVQVDVECQAGQKQAGQAPDGKEPNKTEGVQHRGLKPD